MKQLNITLEVFGFFSQIRTFLETIMFQIPACMTIAFSRCEPNFSF